MNISHRILCFLNSFSVGLFMPVSSLVLLAHGATGATLSLFVGILSGTVLLAEVPSGMFADLFGRKKTFALAKIFLLANNGFLLVGDSPGSLAVACVCHGLGIAFASGSLDALVLENFIKKYGKEKISEINRRLLLLQSSGLVSGSLLGGILGQVGEKYVLLLLVILAVEGSMLIGTLLFVKEGKQAMKENGGISFKEQLDHVKKVISASQFVTMILIVAALTGCVQTVLEVYWQQSLIELFPRNFGWMLGVVSCLGFFAGMIGNNIGESLFEKWGDKGFRRMKVLLPILVSVVGICKNGLLFVIFFLLVYMLLGAGEYTERFILHKEVVDQCRASMLSLYSLAIRLGGIFASLVAGFLVTGGSLMVWIVIPVAVAVLMLVFFG